VTLMWLPGKNRPEDERNFGGPMNLAMANENVTIYAWLTDDVSDVVRILNSPGSYFSYYFAGILFTLLFLSSCYIVVKMRRQCGWGVFVVVIEGVFAGFIRLFKCFVAEPYIVGPNFVIDAGHYINSADAPFACMSTFVTAAVWIKVVRGKILSTSRRRFSTARSLLCVSPRLCTFFIWA